MTSTLTPVRKRSALTKGQLPKYAPYVVLGAALVLSSGALTASLIQSGNQTIAAEIALNFPEASGLKVSTLIAAGLVLFIITLAVNMIARWIITRHKEFSGAN